jgi:hemoglobin-like flavoprotein
MTPSDIALIRSGFRSLAGAPDALAGTFYARLFELDPGLRPLFKGDMTEQGRKLVMVLAHVVQALDRLDAIVADVRSLGRRHAAYGVEPRHYDTVGAALLDALAARLGAAFDAEARAAWARAYTVLAGVMITAAAEMRPAA